MDTPETDATAVLTLDPAEVCQLWDLLFLADADTDGGQLDGAALAETTEELAR